MFGRRKVKDSGESKSRGSTLLRVLRTVFFALFFAFLVGFVIGTILRGQLERPERYIGDRSTAENAEGRLTAQSNPAIPIVRPV